MPSLADFLAAYGGSPDPENPSSGEITPGIVLRAIGHTIAPGQVGAPVFDPDRIDPSRGSAFTPAATARDYATALSAGKNKPPDPLETMLGVAGGSPATFIGPMARTFDRAALARANELLAAGKSAEEVRQATGININAAGQPQQEISDAGSVFHMPPKGIQGATLGQVFEHPALYEAYPEIRDLPVKFEHPAFNDPRFVTAGGLVRQQGDLTGQPTLILNPKVVPTEEEMRSNVLHEVGGHYVSGREGFPAGGGTEAPEVQRAALKTLPERRAAYETALEGVYNRRDAYVAAEKAKNPHATNTRKLEQQYFDQVAPEDATIARAALEEQGKYHRGRMQLEEEFKHYKSLAGEEQARVIQKSADKTQAELLAGPSPEARSDTPYAQQLLRFQPRFKVPGEGPSQGDFGFNYDLPSFTDRMAGARDVAFAGRQRGTGNILPRSTANEAPLLAPGETRGDLQSALTPGIPPAETSIADVGRNTYRDRLFGQRLDPAQLELSTKPTTEMTPIGEQYVLPGAEALTPAQMAQRQAEAALKAKVPQQAPGGMFDEPGGEQLGLELSSRLRKEPQAPAVLRPDRPLFDLSPQGLARSHVQREQFDIPRTAAETVTPEYERATSKANIARVNREVAQGIKEHGLDWHAMGQLRDRYIAELGEKAGAAEFERYMREVGATSPNSNVEQNFRTASYYAQQRRAGEPLPQISYKRSTGNPYLPPREAPPTPYGNTAQGLHVMNLGLLERGEPYPLSRPKVPSFTENMLGNYRPVAVDRHNLRMWGIDAEAPNLTGYKHLERTQQEQAGKMGIHPAQYQAAPWPFYAKSGADPALALFDKRLTHTAEQRGQTKAQVLRDFIRGQAPLLSLTPAAVLLGQGQPAPEPVQ